MFISCLCHRCIRTWTFLVDILTCVLASSLHSCVNRLLLLIRATYTQWIYEYLYQLWWYLIAHKASGHCLKLGLILFRVDFHLFIFYSHNFIFYLLLFDLILWFLFNDSWFSPSFSHLLYESSILFYIALCQGLLNCHIFAFKEFHEFCLFELESLDFTSVLAL